MAYMSCTTMEKATKVRKPYSAYFSSIVLQLRGSADFNHNK